jgi:hypothetical protein
MICVCGMAHEHEPVCRTLQSLHDLFSMRELHEKVDKIMSALTDLQAADEALKAEVAQFLTDIAGRLGTVDDASAEAVVADIQAEVAALQGADPATPPATPPATA